MEKLTKQPCPVCGKKTLTLIQDEKDMPYFGKVYIFTMKCDNCKYNKSDIEVEDQKEPQKVEITIDNKKDMDIRVVKSSSASLKIPQMRMSVESGPDSNGYVSNIEGLLERFKKILEQERDSEDDPKVRKHAKNLLKKLWKVTLGEQPLKIIIEDPTGNSAIISDKAKITKLKVKN